MHDNIVAGLIIARNVLEEEEDVPAAVFPACITVCNSQGCDKFSEVTIFIPYFLH